MEIMIWTFPLGSQEWKKLVKFIKIIETFKQKNLHFIQVLNIYVQLIQLFYFSLLFSCTDLIGSRTEPENERINFFFLENTEIIKEENIVKYWGWEKNVQELTWRENLLMELGKMKERKKEKMDEFEHWIDEQFIWKICVLLGIDIDNGEHKKNEFVMEKPMNWRN